MPVLDMPVFLFNVVDFDLPAAGRPIMLPRYLATDQNA